MFIAVVIEATTRNALIPLYSEFNDGAVTVCVCVSVQWQHFGICTQQCHYEMMEITQKSYKP